MAVSAAVAGVVVAAGAASHTADVQHEAQGDAKAAQNKAEINQDEAVAEAQRQQDDQQKAAGSLAARAQARSKLLSSGAAAPNSTILTSPLGIPSTPNQGGGKTLIGS